MLRNSDIHIRDPFVHTDTQASLYYLYGTTGSEAWGQQAQGIDYYTSTDLETWDGPFPAFRAPAGFWADRNFWAPEVHAYQGAYYMFISLKAEHVCRGTQILRAESPAGPFLPITERPVTPADWECLDGTLFVDDNAQPWMIFCHEWVQVGDGEICALPLSADLTQTTGAPQLLFHASEAPWALEINSKGRRGYVTDGPWLHRLAGGALLMLWSSFGAGGYTIGQAISHNGNILGPWQQVETPLYAGDGGHCMTFMTLDGTLRLSYHRPNPTPDERPFFTPIEESAGGFIIAQQT